MDPRLRHLIYHKMGFKLVDFPYVMPPLGLGMPKVRGGGKIEMCDSLII